MYRCSNCHFICLIKSWTTQLFCSWLVCSVTLSHCNECKKNLVNEFFNKPRCRRIISLWRPSNLIMKSHGKVMKFYIKATEETHFSPCPIFFALSSPPPFASFALSCVPLPPLFSFLWSNLLFFLSLLPSFVPPCCSFGLSLSLAHFLPLSSPAEIMRVYQGAVLWRGDRWSLLQQAETGERKGGREREIGEGERWG